MMLNAWLSPRGEMGTDIKVRQYNTKDQMQPCAEQGDQTGLRNI